MRAGVLFGLAACLRAALCADVAIDPSATADSVKVPPGFLGLSLEPVNQTFYMAGDAVFTELLRNLLAYSTGSINLRCVRRRGPGGGRINAGVRRYTPRSREAAAPAMTVRNVPQSRTLANGPAAIRAGGTHLCAGLAG